jgi:hypothetical protein
MGVFTYFFFQFNLILANIYKRNFIGIFIYKIIVTKSFVYSVNSEIKCQYSTYNDATPLSPPTKDGKVADRGKTFGASLECTNGDEFWKLSYNATSGAYYNTEGQLKPLVLDPSEGSVLDSSILGVHFGNNHPASENLILSAGGSVYTSIPNTISDTVQKLMHLSLRNLGADVQQDPPTFDRPSPSVLGVSFDGGLGARGPSVKLNELNLRLQPESDLGGSIGVTSVNGSTVLSGSARLNLGLNVSRGGKGGIRVGLGGTYGSNMPNDPIRADARATTLATLDGYIELPTPSLFGTETKLRVSCPIAESGSAKEYLNRDSCSYELSTSFSW